MLTTIAAPLLAAVTLAGWSPAVWPIALMVVIGVAIALGVAHRPRLVATLTGPAMFGLTISAAVHKPVLWPVGIATAIAVIVGATRINARLDEIRIEADLAQKGLRHQAETDELTGLANRTRYLGALREHLDSGEGFAVLIMDLNRFKTINDTLGHGFGDEVLVQIAGRLVQVTAPDDVVARLGGDEFAVISVGSRRPADAERLASRIASAASRAMEIAGMSISTTLSCGIAIAPRDGRDVQSLMRHADIAMYEAKRRGYTVQAFSSEIEQTPLEELTLSAGLKAALAGDQFRLHYQPKVDLVTGEVTGFEALSRWQHPTLGLLSPDRFIHLVTLSDECQAFADRIIRVGIEFAVTCRDQGKPVPVAVNLSARSLFDDTLPERTAGLLQRHSLDPELLIIEITEADIMDEAGHSSRVLARLSSLGVRISIDDFGTGYSSLARLVDLPISEIKIDRHFVSQAIIDRRDEVIVRSIVDLAETLDLNIVAEGVEDQTGKALLLNAGCGEAQGYLFSPPVPETEALVMLRNGFVIEDRVAITN